MGQKTHPKGFRLITTQKHLSQWYSAKLKYPLRITEDFILREKLEKAIKDFLVCSEIEINRAEIQSNGKEHVILSIFALQPLVTETQKFFSILRAVNLDVKSPSTEFVQQNSKQVVLLLIKQKILPLLRNFYKIQNKTFSLRIILVKNRFDKAILIAKYLVEQLEKRVPFRRAIKETFKNINAKIQKGLKIQVSGRLNGIDIARSEWKREGSIPLHTLNANIDYAHEEAKTIYGIIGIKVWLYNQ